MITLYSLWFSPRRGLRREGQHDVTRGNELNAFNRTTEAYWIVPATDIDDPLYEASYAMEAYDRSHRTHYWLGQYPK